MKNPSHFVSLEVKNKMQQPLLYFCAFWGRREGGNWFGIVPTTGLCKKKKELEHETKRRETKKQNFKILFGKPSTLLWESKLESTFSIWKNNNKSRKCFFFVFF
jgi:hypothetical protein